MAASVSEVVEASATGLVADLYQDIRLVTGARLVNLVWRHLATDPAVLEWAWRAVRPGLQSGFLPARAQELRVQAEGVAHGWLPNFPVRMHLPASDAAQALAVAQTYSHTNCLNMMALTWLLCPHAGSRSDGRPTHHDSTPPPHAQLPALPPLPAWNTLDAGTLRSIQTLNAMAETQTPHVVASLYRHLALWPSVLVMAEQVLAPLQQAGLLLTERIRTADRAHALLDKPLPPPGAAPASFNTQFAPFLQALRSVTIAKMIPIGCLLQQLLQQHCGAQRR